MEKVSVIIPVYNVEWYIARCLDSVTGQTYTNLEIIAVDDGSTDTSGVICDKYAENDSRIKVIHTENGGPGRARNLALNAVTGEYIMFIDSDDYMAPDSVEFLLNRLHEFDADISACGYTYVDENGNMSPQEKVSFTADVISTEVYWRLFYTDIRIYYVAVWAKLYKKSLWEAVRFPENKLHEDEFVTHLFLRNCSKIAVSKKPLYYYFQRSGSIMNSGYKEKNLDAAEGMIVRGRFFADKGNYPLALSSLEMAMYSIIKGYGFIGYTERVKELHGMFRRLYRRLVFKKCDNRMKLKCGLFCISVKSFARIKNGRDLNRPPKVRPKI